MAKEHIIKGEDLRMKSKQSMTKLWIDEKAKSLSYFCKQSLVVIEKSAIDELKKISKKYGENARICLHSSPKDGLHDMIILEHQHQKCRIPHKHLEKCETLQMIEGKMAALVFSENGDVLEEKVLSPDKNFMCRIGQNQYHLYLPISSVVIYKETKPGPFKREDNILPDWDYVKTLKKYFSYIGLELECENKWCMSSRVSCPFIKNEW